MPAPVIPIGESSPSSEEHSGRAHLAGEWKNRSRRAHWSLLEVAAPGCSPVPLGILFVDSATDELSLRCRATEEIESLCGLEEQETDILDYLEDDLRQKASERGGAALLDSLEQTLSNF